MEVHSQPTRKRTEEASLEVLALLLSAEVRLLTKGIINQTMILRFVPTRLNATVHAPWATTWKPPTSCLGFLVCFPAWPCWPWSSHQSDLAKQIRPGHSPLTMMRATLITHSTNKPHPHQAWLSGPFISAAQPQPGGERGWGLPTRGPEGPESTAAPLAAAAPLPPPGESTGRNF